jgi:hypothetical protein
MIARNVMSKPPGTPKEDAEANSPYKAPLDQPMTTVDPKMKSIQGWAEGWAGKPLIRWVEP